MATEIRAQATGVRSGSDDSFSPTNVWNLERRTFLRASMLTALGAVAGVGTLSGCTSSNGSSDANATGNGRGAAISHAIMGTAGSYQGFNPDKPSTIANGPSLQVVQACYDSLTDVPIPAKFEEAFAASSKGLPANPKLAEKWEVSADQKQWTFTLRQAKSSAGNTLTANDVKWSYEKALDAAFVAAFLLGLQGITKADQFKVIDDRTLQISLPAPAPAYFLQSLGLAWLPIYDSKEAKQHATAKDPFAQDWLDKNVRGFGPYTVKDATPGKSITLEANADYWGEKPAISQITQQGIDDSGTRLQLLLGGTLHYAESLTPTQMQTVASSPNAVATNFTSSRTAMIVTNTLQAPFDKAEFRQALAKVIPYDEILTTVYGGRARRWKTLITPWFQGATDEFWAYDGVEAEASKVLGAYSGPPLKLSYAKGFGAGEQIAIFVQQALKKAGVDCQLDALTKAVYSERANKRELAFSINDSDSPAIPTTLYNLNLWYTSDAFQNFANYKNPKIDTLTADLAASVQIEEQTKVIRQIQKILVADLPYIPIAYTGTDAAHIKSMNGVQAHEIGLVYYQDLSIK